MKQKIFSVLSFIILLSACQQSQIVEDELKQKAPFVAAVEEVEYTRTCTDEDYNVLWMTGDRIAVFERSTLPDIYQLNDMGAGTSSCRFDYVDTPGSGSVAGVDIEHTVAYYPYDETVTCSDGESEGVYELSVNLPSVQSYSQNSIGEGALPMVAVTDALKSRNLMFYNLCGVLRFDLKGQGSVTSIVLNGHDNERLSGNARVTAYFDGTMPEIKMDAAASKTVTLECKTPVELDNSRPVSFFMVVPPTKFKTGFTLTVNTADGKCFKFDTFEKTNAIERAIVLEMPEVFIEAGRNPESAPQINDPGIAYMWDESVIPEITIKITEDEWNDLLARYDEYDHNVDYFHADFEYKKGSEVTYISDGGLRLRGNTSRRRPEGYYGQKHNPNAPDWHHCHFGINFRKFHKDDDHTIKGIRKVNLKWFKDDPNYVRELYCYDLFRRYGIWTAAHDVYSRVWLKVGDETPAYLGVFEMIETVDEEYVERRLPGMFENHKGNLWKCGHANSSADLKDLDGSWAVDLDNGVNYDYEFKGDKEDYSSAKAQLEDFILKLTGKGEESFYKWIKEVCDVEFLLKTYAVNVVVGMCDDFWNNGNNYYLYFNTTDKFEYKVFFIPYDYDNTLGTSWNCGIISDTGRQDPYNWGDTGLLMERLMRFDEFRQIYKNALQELVAEENGLFHVDASIARIKAWQNKISPYVENDTDEDMYIYDQAASWGNNQNYKLLTKGSNNFFQVKTATVNAMR